MSTHNNNVYVLIYGKTPVPCIILDRKVFLWHRHVESSFKV